MPRWLICERKAEALIEHPEPAVESPSVAPQARVFQAPPQRTTGETSALAGGDKLTRLLQRRDGVVFDVDQAERAAQLDNPWRQRMALIDEAIATIAVDRAALEALPVRPGLPLPAQPIVDIEVVAETPAAVRFRIGSEHFAFAEEIDWAERGTQLAQPELFRVSGDVAQLVPASFPSDRVEELRDHLSASLFVLAVDFRDRAIKGVPLWTGLTLSDLAPPCQACGGWRDVHGTCAECQRRQWRRDHLADEETRLRSEREREDSDRARLAERLPVARRRLAEVDAEIAATQT